MPIFPYPPRGTPNPASGDTMPDDQVNDPKTCPNPACRSTSFDVYDTDGGPPSDYIIAKCACDECDYSWQDEYKVEFVKRAEVDCA